MSRRLSLCGALALALSGFAARADEPAAKGHTLRATSTVEVIEDARQVDEIIARVKARQAAEAEPERKDPSPPKAERPSLPRAESLEKMAPQKEPQRTERARERRRDEKRDRERDRTTPAIRR